MHKKHLLLIVCVIFVIIFTKELYANNYKKDAMETSGHTMVILLHLYNLNLMDELITKINNFIKSNNQNKYYIKIAIPIDSNIMSYTGLSFQEQNFLCNKEKIYNVCSSLAIYHPEKITRENCIKLYLIKAHLESNLLVDQDKIQILFLENRGVDVGSFLLLIDQLIQQNIEHDFIIKMHTKTHDAWRNRLLAILQPNINEILKNNECVYACDSYLSSLHHRALFLKVVPHLKTILHYFNLPYVDGIRHCAGTMFIASNKLTAFFKNYDRIAFFNMFSLGFPRKEAPLLEHGFEVFLGYCFEYLGFRRHILSDFWREAVLFVNSKWVIESH